MFVKDGSEAHFEPGSWGETFHDIYIGAMTGLGHQYTLFIKYPIEFLMGTATKPRTRNEDGKLKVVGVGFGRTGTVRH